MMDILEQYKHVKEHGEPAEIFLWMEEAVKEIEYLRVLVERWDEAYSEYESLK